jgi:ribosomal protein L9
MERKNPAAVELGRRGGSKKVKKGFATLTPEQRAEKAREGALARWASKAKKKKT